MIKKIVLFILVFSVVMPNVNLSVLANLATWREQRRQVQQSVQQARNELAAVGREVRAAEREMEALDYAIMQITEDMLVLNDDIILVEERYEEAYELLLEARRYRDAQEAIVHERLRLLHEYGQPGLLDVLVQATSVWDFLIRLEAVDRIAGQDQQMLARLEDAELQYLSHVEDEARLRNTLESLLRSLQLHAEEMNHLMMQWEEEFYHLLIQQTSFEDLLAAYQAQERTLAQNIAREENRIRADEEARRLEALQNFSGRFLWPTPGFTRVTSGFGNRRNPFNRRVYQFHAGIDIAGPGINGTPVVAAEEGFVTRAATGWNGGFGTMVIITHGGGYQTLYAHLSSLNVREGNHVNRGDIIGRVGSTGSSTGPHLHFEVRRNGRSVNPMPYFGR